MKRILSFFILMAVAVSLSCRRNAGDHITVALSDAFSTFDSLTTEKSDAAAERIRNLIFNSLVRKNEAFDYEGELAKEILTSDDGRSVTFVLRDGVKFHNGKVLTAADVKYTFDELFKSKGYKSFAYFDVVNKQSVPHITAIETPDDRTVVFKLQRASLKNQLLSNLVATPIIAEGTASQQKQQPQGSGPFKFVSFDATQNIVELEAFADHWEGVPEMKKLRVKTVPDASALQAELQTGGVDIAPMPSNLPPDTLNALKTLGTLNVAQFDGSNIQYLGFNVTSPPLDNVKVRQAIGHAIDREKIIRELLSGQAKIANSILPEGSWAYSPGNTYNFDPARAKQLLEEAGYKNQPITFKFSSGNAAYSSYAQAIQSMLVAVGLNIQIETLDPNTIRENLAKGQFQMNTAVWIGGNQDPLFLKDLFTTAKIPSPDVACCNRARYSNPEVDKLLDDAVNETDRGKARELYAKAWDIISRDLPLLPLWYPSNMVISNKRVSNVKIGPSGDWTFLKDVRINQG